MSFLHWLSNFSQSLRKNGVPTTVMNLQLCQLSAHFIGIWLLIVVSYDPLYFCVVCCNFFISFIILLIWVFYLFFLMILSILFIFSRNQLLVLLICSIVSCISFSFISALIFTISFFLLTLGFFFCYFSSCCRCKVRLFIWCFSSFLEVGLYCYKPPP